eukprot:7198392-Ditylum_brightwellii.AAC.1
MKVEHIFKCVVLKDDHIEKQINFVWADTTHGAAAGETTHYFKVFAAKPADGVALNAARNQRQLKHVMLGTLLWNSLAPKFQLEMLTKETSFKREDNYNGMLL